MFVYISFRPAEGVLASPQITSNDHYHVIEGQDLLLNCSLEIDIGGKVSLKWELPTKNQAVKVISVS